MENEEHNWIKLKKYPHIGFPLESKNIPYLESYITDTNKITKHSFLPFLHRTIVQRKFRPNGLGLKNKSKKRKREKTSKEREIFYASHFDAQIYSYYSYLLSEKYNNLLKTKDFEESVVAYRKIPIEKGSKKNKCNIDFALDAFQFIKQNNDKELTVIVADITKFFDNLDYKLLKQKWTQVWNNSSTLEDDHYRVYKSLTDMRFVNEDLLFRNFKDKIWVKKGVKNKPNKFKFEQKSVTRKKFLKDNNAIAYCDKDVFYKKGINLISKSTRKKGIPQGTALSATLANIYMLDFDQEVHNLITEVSGYYQRYSDDLIIVIPRKNQSDVIKKIRELVSEKAKLEIHQEKTKVYHFQKTEGEFKGYEVDEVTGVKRNKTLEYLGFEYDGQRALLKTAGYSKFYRSMKRSFKRSVSLAINSKSTDDKIHKSGLYKRFTYKGSKRRKVYNKGKSSYHYDWGNYLSYVEKANIAFQEFNGGNQIKKQSRKTWTKFYALMTSSELKVEKEIKLREKKRN